MFWRDSKLSEMPPQTLPTGPDTTAPGGMHIESKAESARPKSLPKSSHLLVLPVPQQAAPLDAVQLLQNLILPLSQQQSASVQVRVLSNQSHNRDPSETRQTNVTIGIDGVLLLVKSSCVSAPATVGHCSPCPPFLCVVLQANSDLIRVLRT